jgi:hypothetical protein
VDVSDKFMEIWWQWCKDQRWRGATAHKLVADGDEDLLIPYVVEPWLKDWRHVVMPAYRALNRLEPKYPGIDKEGRHLQWMEDHAMVYYMIAGSFEGDERKRVAQAFLKSGKLDERPDIVDRILDLLQQNESPRVE